MPQEYQEMIHDGLFTAELAIESPRGTYAGPMCHPTEESADPHLKINLSVGD